MQWMESQGFFTEQGFSLVPGNIHFASSRSEKLSRIGDLACFVHVRRIARSLIEIERRACEESVVVEEAGTSDDAVFDMSSHASTLDEDAIDADWMWLSERFEGAGHVVGTQANWWQGKALAAHAAGF